MSEKEIKPHFYELSRDKHLESVPKQKEITDKAAKLYDDTKSQMGSVVQSVFTENPREGKELIRKIFYRGNCAKVAHGLIDSKRDLKTSEIGVNRNLAQIQVSLYVLKEAEKMPGGLTAENIKAAYKNFQERVRNLLGKDYDLIFDGSGNLIIKDGAFAKKAGGSAWDKVEKNILSEAGIPGVKGRCMAQNASLIPKLEKILPDVFGRVQETPRSDPQRDAGAANQPEQQTPETSNPQERTLQEGVILDSAQKVEGSSLGGAELKVPEITVNLAATGDNTIDVKTYKPRRDNEALTAALISGGAELLFPSKRERGPKGKETNLPPGENPPTNPSPPPGQTTPPLDAPRPEPLIPRETHGSGS